MRSPEPERLKDVLHEAGHPVAETADGTFEIDGTGSEELGELAARHRIVLHELSPQRASLEEAFMRMTAESVEYHAHSGGERGPIGALGRGSRASVHRTTLGRDRRAAVHRAPLGENHDGKGA